MSYKSPESKMFWALVHECLPANTPPFQVFLGKWYQRWWASLLTHVGPPLIMASLGFFWGSPFILALMVFCLSAFVSAILFLFRKIPPMVELQMFGGHFKGRTLTEGARDFSYEDLQALRPDMPVDVLFSLILQSYQEEDARQQIQRVKAERETAKQAHRNQLATQRAKALLLRVRAQKKVQEELAKAEAEVEKALQEAEVGDGAQKKQAGGSVSHVPA